LRVSGKCMIWGCKEQPFSAFPVKKQRIQG
jgi:hypothetical protein